MNLTTFVTIFHVLLAAGLIAIVLLQKGKGADAGAGFGAGASGTVFGARGSASFLSRTTAVLATLFFVTSLALAFLAGQREAPVSVLEVVPAAEQGAGEVPGQLVPQAEEDLPALPGTDQPTEQATEQPSGDDVGKP
jgi:preprotein translocase subunit SecG